MPAIALLPAVDPAEDYLISSETWSDHDALKTIESQLLAYLAHLDPGQRKRYLALAKETPRHKQQLAESLQRFKAGFERRARHDLGMALHQASGKHIDLDRSQLHTQALKIPPRDDAKDPIELICRIIEQYRTPRSRRAADPSAPLPQVISVSLWQAAKDNFSFTGATPRFASGFDFKQHSHISAVCEQTGEAVALDMASFISRVRSLDLGSRLRRELHEAMASRINQQLADYQTARLELDLLEALRGSLRVAGQRLWPERFMAAAADPQLLAVQFYSLDFGRAYLPDFSDSQALPLPFCLMRFEQGTPPGVFSYFPERPGGALRHHSTAALALEALRRQIREDAAAQRIGWLTQALSLADQAEFYHKLKALPVDETQLSAPARLLYKAFADTTPAAQRINLLATRQPQRHASASLLDSLAQHQSQRLGADIAALASTRRSLDWQTLIGTLQWMASETLELLLMPLPGGVLGLNRLMISASLGTLAYQSIVASTELASGRQLEFVQAVTDIAELIISTRIQAIGARLSARRARKLIEALGRPQRTSQATDAPLWLREFQAEPPFAPGATKAWPVAIDGLADHQLLERMLRPDLPALNDPERRRLLALAGLSRAALENIWRGEGPVPWAANQAIAELQVRKSLDLLQQVLDSRDAALVPYPAEQALPSLLVRQLQAPLQIEPREPGPASRYAAVQDAGAVVKPTIILREVEPGLYRPTYAADSSPAGALLETCLKAYEQLNQRPWLGASATADRPGTSDQRLADLRQALAEDLRKHSPSLFLALLDRPLRADLQPSHPAYAFAPVSQAGRLAGPAVRMLRERFGGLSQAAAIELIGRYPTLNRIALDSSLAPQVLAAVQGAQQHSRIISALASFTDSAERGFGQDSEALFCRLLCSLPRWPGNLEIRIDPGLDSSGQARTWTQPSRRYGLDTATVTLGLLRSGERYMGIDPAGRPIQVPMGEPSLASSLLRSLDDARRDALGYRLDEPRRLVDDLLQFAHEHRDDLKELLPTVRQYRLSPTRLADFRQERHFAISGDEHALYNFAGRRYVTIDGGAYQVMDDRDASSPGRPVYRIVKPQDPVASDPDNRYIATRSGRSEPITRGADGQWVGIVVGGAGGMPRETSRLEAIKQRDSALISEMEIRHKALRSSEQRLPLLLDAISRAADDNARRAARVAHEVYLRTHLNLLEQLGSRYETHKELWIKKGENAMYRHELQSLKLSQVDYYTRLFLAEDDNFIALVGPRLPPPLSELPRFRLFNRAMLASLDKRMPVLEQRQAVIASLLELAPGPETEQRIARIIAGTPGSPRAVAMGKLVALSNLFSVGDTADPQAPPIFHFEATREMTRFRELYVALEQTRLVPENRQIAVLDNLLEQLATIREGFEAMNYFPASARETAHQQAILNIVDSFDKVIASELGQRYERAASNEALSTSLDAIDLDFLPVQPTTSAAPAPRKRLIKVRRGGVDTLKIGQERRADNGETQIDIIEQDNLGIPFQSYREVNGQWRGTLQQATLAAEPAEKLPASVIRDARHRLAQVQTYQAKAHRDEAARRNPSNIIEYLDSQAEQLDQDATTLEALPASEAPQAATLATRLRQAGQGLRSEGENIRLRMYKDPNVLSLHRLLYLIEHDQLSVHQQQKRVERGKGAGKHYLDVYSIRDKASQQELWHAHFHYARKDAAAQHFELKGGHLKTLAQSRLGLKSQIRQQQQGLPPTPIWREAFDGRTAQRLFDLAS